MANVNRQFSRPVSKSLSPPLVTIEGLSKASPDLLDVARRVIALPDGGTMPLDVAWLVAELQKIRLVAQLAVHTAECGAQ